MLMYKLLFIIPKLGTGGTNSSLDSLYPLLKNQFEISVFSISHHPISHNYSFCEALLPRDYWLSLIYANYSDQKGLNKLLAFLVKVVRTVMWKVNIDIGKKRCKRIALKLEKKVTYDYIVAYQEGNATLFASLFNNPHKIAWLHVDYNKYLPIENSEEHIYAQFQTIVGVSKYTTEVFAERYPSLANRTMVINNLLDVPRIQQLSKQPVDDSRYIADKFTIISVGRFGKVKRFSQIPLIAAELKKRGMVFVWYILGPIYQMEEVTAFMYNLDKYGVQETVKWLGSKSNPYPYYKSANLYVCLSETEACPMVFKEALLFGLPIVTTDFPSSFEFIENGRNGLITSFKEIPKTLQNVIENKSLYDKLKEGAKDFTFDNQTVLNTIISIF